MYIQTSYIYIEGTILTTFEGTHNISSYNDCKQTQQAPVSKQ